MSLPTNFLKDQYATIEIRELPAAQEVTSLGDSADQFIGVTRWRWTADLVLFSGYSVHIDGGVSDSKDDAERAARSAVNKWKAAIEAEEGLPPTIIKVPLS